MAEYVTSDTPTIRFVSVLTRQNPPAGEVITADTPSVGITFVLVRYNPPAGEVITDDAPIIEFTWQSGVKVVIELVKLNVDGTETVLNSINDIIIGKLENRWVKLEAEVVEDNNNVNITLKLLNVLEKLIDSWTFTTTEMKGIGGAVGLFSEIKTFIDYVTMKYSKW